MCDTLAIKAPRIPLSVSLNKHFLRGCVLCAGVVLAACTPAQPGAQFNDPYESTNRGIHEFNKGLDQALLRPAGQVTAATPEVVTTPVANFADNVGLPGMIVNGILQGDIGGAATNTMRFVLNTTVGFGGLFDPAGGIGLNEETTDFGETLAVWGAPEGAYLELPVLGPSTERDAVGQLVDLVIDPLARYGTAEQARAATAARVADVAISRGRFGDTVDSVLYDSADSYAQARLLYLQNRRFELGVTDESTGIDPFADPFIDPFAEPFE
ncbi:VacJ family lipoprotein [Octadecabacter sp. SW4]|nr:VacJ family lipoprotein [Octadecabacter sp. SW4]